MKEKVDFCIGDIQFVWLAIVLINAKRNRLSIFTLFVIVSIRIYIFCLISVEMIGFKWRPNFVKTHPINLLLTFFQLMDNNNKKPEIRSLVKHDIFLDEHLKNAWLD